MPATPIGPALDKIMTDMRAETKTPVRFIEPAPWDTYEGNVVWTRAETRGPNDYAVKSVVGQFDGLPTQTTTS